MKPVHRAVADTYSNLLYASKPGVDNNNCYAYSIDHYRDNGEAKLQPGDLAGIGGEIDLATCDDLVRRVLEDGKAMGWTIRHMGCKDGRCPEGSTKIVALLDPNNDFHFMRFHRDLLYRVKTPRTAGEIAKEFGVRKIDISIPGSDTSNARSGDLVLIRRANCWSQKSGFSPEGPLLRDACGKVIKDVRAACRNMGEGLNYKVICGFFCLDKNETPSGTLDG